MAQSLNNILQAVGADVDQDTTIPTGTELTTRINLVNRAIQEWSMTYNWSASKKTFSFAGAQSQVSAALPADFKEFASPIFDLAQGLNDPNSQAGKYPEIKAEQRFTKLTTDKYVIVRGDDSTGKYIEISPALLSSASMSMEYYSRATSLVTLADISPVPNYEYIPRRTSGFILQSRQDARFPQTKADADRMLATMIEEEVAAPGSQQNRVPDVYRENNFKLGRD
jgi:hypothetical protein